MVTAFPQKAKAGLCALISCCFQPAHTPEPTDESRYMIQEKTKRRSAADEEDQTTAILPNYQNPPRWIKDDLVEACVSCGVEFDLLKRKHHCRGCGLVFCGGCTSNFDRVVKFGFVEPVRLCNSCSNTAKTENVFYENFCRCWRWRLFSKYGLLRKRHVFLKFVRAKNIFQTYEGDIKAIPLDEITDVREVDVGQDNSDLGIVLAVGPQEHRFDATTALKRQQWMEAIAGARFVRGAMLAAEREKRAKQAEKENEEIRKMSENLQKMEERRATFQEDRLRRRAEKREQLRAKYHLATAAS
ncbi:Zinc finger, FYVE-related [Phytophthora cactorum]|nr:Zinc finger, FYVE-related [Phytophthora cactorum]